MCGTTGWRTLRSSTAQPPTPSRGLITPRRAGIWDRVVQRRLRYTGQPGKQLKLTMNMSPLILHQLYITSQPAAVYSVNGLPNNYLFAKNRGVAVASRFEGDTLRVNVDSTRDAAEVMVPGLSGTGRQVSATLDGQTVEPRWVAEDGGAICSLFAVPKGRHELRIDTRERKDVLLKAAGVCRRGWKRRTSWSRCPGVERAVFTVSREGRTLYNREAPRRDGVFRIPQADVCEAGDYTLTCAAVVSGDAASALSDLSATVALPKRRAPLGLPSKDHPRVPAKLKIEPVNKTVNGVNVLQSAEYCTSTALIGWQPKLAGVVSETDAANLKLHAGTTRKIHGFRGAAYSGLEIKDLRKVKLKLENTYCTTTHNRGKGQHQPAYHRSKATFGGMIVDYHTPKGYTWRVGYSVGLLAPHCTATRPDYGKKGRMDKIIDFGPIVNEGPEKILALDLAQYAPKDWDGQVWFSVGSEWAAPDRRLTATLLAVNDAVTDGFLEGTDPDDLAKEYEKPKRITVPRAPVRPNIDGSADDEMWQHAATIEKFFLLGGKGYPKSSTRVQVFNDDENLYVGVMCRDPERDKPIINHGNIWLDDELEFMIDTDGDPKTYVQILVNGIGNVAAFRAKDEADLGVEAKALQERGMWMLEIVIPFKGLGVKAPKSGDTWGFNVVRNRQAGPTVGAEWITWAPLKRGFVEPENLGKMVFE